MDPTKTAYDRAMVVLGCPVLAGGRLCPAAERRAERAASAFHAWTAEAVGSTPLVVVSGGRRWHRQVEAIAIAERLVLLGVPRRTLVLELCSLSTLENAAYSSEILRLYGIFEPAIVTCDWHMPRALACFEWMGIAATALPATSPRRSAPAELARTIRERMGRLFDRRVAAAWGNP
jgi:uncharacterized SAM-binding protein YcdF (DUF218 family)